MDFLQRGRSRRARAAAQGEAPDGRPFARPRLRPHGKRVNGKSRPTRPFSVLRVDVRRRNSHGAVGGRASSTPHGAPFAPIRRKLLFAIVGGHLHGILDVRRADLDQAVHHSLTMVVVSIDARQRTFTEPLALLPSFEVLTRYPNDVLLRNRALAAK